MAHREGESDWKRLGVWLGIEITFTCQGCGQNIICDRDEEGQEIKCSTCGCAIVVPPLGTNQKADSPALEAPRKGPSFLLSVGASSFFGLLAALLCWRLFAIPAIEEERRKGVAASYEFLNSSLNNTNGLAALTATQTATRIQGEFDTASSIIASKWRLTCGRVFVAADLASLAIALVIREVRQKRPAAPRIKRRGLPISMGTAAVVIELFGWLIWVFYVSQVHGTQINMAVYGLGGVSLLCGGVLGLVAAIMDDGRRSGIFACTLLLMLFIVFG